MMYFFERLMDLSIKKCVKEKKNSVQHHHCYKKKTIISNIANENREWINTKEIKEHIIFKETSKR